jgi:hypothetical protein
MITNIFRNLLNAQPLQITGNLLVAPLEKLLVILNADAQNSGNNADILIDGKGFSLCIGGW